MKNPRILIVDDDAGIRGALRALLASRSDWSVCGEASNGLEAIDNAKRLGPDLVLMDISMPRMDGLKAAEAIRKELPDCEVIIVSQNDPEIVSRQAQQVKASGHVAKSELGRSLIPAIERIFSNSHNGGSSWRPEAATNLLASIVESSNDAIISKNLNGVVTSWNRAAEEMFGYTAREAVGQNITLIIPANHLDEEAHILKQLRAGERVEHFQTIRRRKDGSLLDVSLTISPLRDSSGRVIGASKVARDITAQRRAEEALRQSEERLRAIVETTPECVKVVAPDGTLLHMNAPGLHMVGASDAEDVIGKNVYDLIAPEDRDRFRAFNEKICLGEKGSLEFDIVGLQGIRRQMETHAAPLHNPDGSLVQLGITRDVSDRNRAQERERQITAEAVAAQAKFRAVFEQTTVFAGIMTKDGIMVEANKLCLEACGYRAEEVLGRPFWETGWWRNFEESREKIRAATPAAAAGTPYRETLHYSWADGTQRLVDFALYPIVDDKGEVLFLHPTGVDITDLKRAEENYRALAESLEAEVRARTEELERQNTEVTRHAEQLRALSRRMLEMQDNERRHIARELHDSAGQTLTVLGINLARIRQEAEKKAPQLAKLAQETDEFLRQLSQEIRTTSYLLHPPLLDESGLEAALSWYVRGLEERSGLRIRLKIQDRFERLSPDLELVIFRIVQECLTNVHRHSGSKTASIELARHSDAVSLKIQDQGRGIDSKQLETISKSAGVGIRGMRERVRQFDGKIDISSNASGTKVCVSFPRAARDATLDEQTRSIQAADQAANFL